LVGVYLTT